MIDIDSLAVKPDGIIIVTAPQDRWSEITEVLSAKLPPHLQNWSGAPVLFLLPGEKIASLSNEELAEAGLRRI